MKLSSDYDRPIAESIRVLEDSGITDFPIDFRKIQKTYYNLFDIRSYKSFMEKHGVTRGEVISLLESEDGATVSNNGKFIIYYNDANVRSRNRFTIAHEIGHIFLDHHFYYGKSLLSKDVVGKDLYQLLENEANCFARNLLCPVCAVEKLFKEHGIVKFLHGDRYEWIFDKEKQNPVRTNLTTRFYPEDLLMENFDVSEDAAEKRIAFLSTDHTHSRSKSCDADYSLIKEIKLHARWHCTRCKTERINRAKYCCECGEHSGFIYGIRKGKNYRHGISIINGHFEICPVCGNSKISRNAKFCKICGSPLLNACAEDKNHINHPQAKFCQECGKSTVYSELGIQDVINETLCDEEYEMFYQDGPEMNEDKRVIKCPRCGNEEFSDNAEFCRVCGLPVFNYCEGEEQYDYHGNYLDTTKHKNPGNARFCEICGRKTTYYTEKLLKDWTVIKRENNSIDNVVPF